MNHIWQGWITPPTPAWASTTPHIWSADTLGLITKRLNHGPHQWCSDPMIVIYVSIWCVNVVWVLYQVWTTSDRGGSPHRPRHDLQLRSIQTQLLPWILQSRGWTMDLIRSVVVKSLWWWHRYGYDIPLLYEYYMRHGPRLTGVDHPTDHIMTWNYTPDILICYPGYWNQELAPCTSSVV